VFVHTDRGVEYSFSLRARNALDYGEQAVQSIVTPEGSESRNLIDGQPRLHFIGTDDSEYIGIFCRLLITVVVLVVP